MILTRMLDKSLHTQKVTKVRNGVRSKRLRMWVKKGSSYILKRTSVG